MKKRSLIMLVCTALILSSIAFGTIAYLTAQDEVTNTFTVGKVSIKVDEAEVDADGKPVTDGNGLEIRTDKNDYTLVPGKEYTKDPTLTVLKNSEDCYVRMLVTYNKAAELNALFPADSEGNKPLYMVEDLNTTDWKLTSTVEDAAANTITFIFNYFNTESQNGIALGSAADNVLPPLFETVKVPATLTGDQRATLEGLQILAKGQAIQVEATGSEAEAWQLFSVQHPAATATTAPAVTPEP